MAPEIIEFLKEKGAKELEISKVEAERLTKGLGDEIEEKEKKQNLM